MRRIVVFCGFPGNNCLLIKQKAFLKKLWLFKTSHNFHIIRNKLKKFSSHSVHNECLIDAAEKHSLSPKGTSATSTQAPFWSLSQCLLCRGERFSLLTHQNRSPEGSSDCSFPTGVLYFSAAS